LGADVMPPFAYDRLPDAAKRRVVQLSLLGFSDAADFEIRVAGWLGAAASKDALPTAPALAPIDPGMVQCFYTELTGASRGACRLAQKGTPPRGGVKLLIGNLDAVRRAETSIGSTPDLHRPDDRKGFRRPPGLTFFLQGACKPGALW
jgi:hypothetical protein